MVLAEVELGMVDGEVEGGVQAGVQLEVGVLHGRLIRVLPHLWTAESQLGRRRHCQLVQLSTAYLHYLLHRRVHLRNNQNFRGKCNFGLKLYFLFDTFIFFNHNLLTN